MDTLLLHSNTPNGLGQLTPHWRFALNNGDTTMTLVDATGWNNATPDAWYYRSFSWWPYVNTKGYSYPNYTYTRNQSHNRVVSYQTNGTWAAGGVVGNVITLTAPWAGGQFACRHSN